MAGSKLIKDLAHVPEIIASLGLSIADAQRALNVDYLDALRQIIAMSRSLLGDKDVPDADTREFLKSMLTQLAPARYQFTETTLTVRLNLAQRFDIAGQVGFGVGTGAIAVNAAFALAYGFDYQAAAECRTVLHAHTMDGNVMDKLLARAEKLSDKAVELPPMHPHEKELSKSAEAIFTKLVGKAPIDPVKEVPEKAAAGAPNP
jgi:hypothetical protein